jgi:hypothetical protein
VPVLRDQDDDEGAVTAFWSRHIRCYREGDRIVRHDIDCKHRDEHELRPSEATSVCSGTDCYCDDLKPGENCRNWSAVKQRTRIYEECGGGKCTLQDCPFCEKGKYAEFWAGVERVKAQCTCAKAREMGADLELGCPVHDDTAIENQRREELVNQRTAEATTVRTCAICGHEGAYEYRQWSCVGCRDSYTDDEQGKANEAARDAAEEMSKGGTNMRATGEKPDPVGPLGMAGSSSDESNHEGDGGQVGSGAAAPVARSNPRRNDAPPEMRDRCRKAILAIGEIVGVPDAGGPERVVQQVRDLVAGGVAWAENAEHFRRLAEQRSLDAQPQEHCDECDTTNGHEEWCDRRRPDAPPDAKAWNARLFEQFNLGLETGAHVVDRYASIHRMRAQSFADDSDRADGEAQADDVEREEKAAELLEYVASRIRAMLPRQRSAAAKPGGGT